MINRAVLDLSKEKSVRLERPNLTRSLSDNDDDAIILLSGYSSRVFLYISSFLSLLKYSYAKENGECVFYVTSAPLFFCVCRSNPERKRFDRPTKNRQTDPDRNVSHHQYERMKSQWMNHQLYKRYMTVFFFQNPNPRSGPRIVYMVTALPYNNHRLL